MSRLLIKPNLIVLTLVVFMPLNSAIANLDRPDPDAYSNPYDIIKTVNLVTQRTNWSVLCNRDNAPIFRDPGSVIVGNGKFLQWFDVLERKDKFLRVKAKDSQNLIGWMDMLHLVMTHSAIKDPGTMVHQKCFIRLRLEEIDSNVEGANILRFRRGPGQGSDKAAKGNQYLFVNSNDQRVSAPSVFLYVYAVHFAASNESQYFDIKSFKNADFFLVGDGPSYASNEANVIRGWIPRQAAVVWDTRQAFEYLPHRPESLWQAHKFADRQLLHKYFNSIEKKSTFLKEHENRVVFDRGEGPPKEGQELRLLVIGKEELHNEVVSENVGWVGASVFTAQGDANIAQSADELNVGIQQQKILAQIQQGAKHIEVFFLVDATLSMQPCLLAAKSVVDKIMAICSKNSNVKMYFYGAVFRDDSEGPDKFNVCEATDIVSVADWFTRQRAYSNLYDDYPEALFYGIKRAVQFWKKRFKDDYSVRILITLGDAGDNGKDGLGIRDIQNLLRDNMILPLAIQFDHTSSCADEDQALRLFNEQMHALNKEVYAPPHLWGVRKVKSEGLISAQIEEVLNSTSELYSGLIKEIADARLGIRSFMSIVCEKSFAGNNTFLIKCKDSCRDEPSCKNFLTENLKDTKPQSSDADEQTVVGLKKAGLLYGWVDMIKLKNPEIWRLLAAQPNLAFNEGFVPLSYKNTRFLRPVLLLADHELIEIKDSIDSITHGHRACNTNENRKLIIRGLATIIGEVMQTSLNLVEAEQLQRWFGIIVDKQQNLNYQTKVDSIIRICNDVEQWNILLLRLEKMKYNIMDILKRRDVSRVYKDIKGHAYYWILPEEILPSLN